jgi:hypothetical protein
MYIVIFGHIFSSIIINTRSLQVQLMEFSSAYPDADVKESPAYQKIILFRSYRLILCSYIALFIIAYATLLVFGFDKSGVQDESMVDYFSKLIF